MCIFNLSFSDALEMLGKEPYYSEFMSLMKNVVETTRLGGSYLKLADLVSQFALMDPEEGFEVFDLVINRSPDLWDDYVLIDNEVFPEVMATYNHILLYFKIKEGVEKMGVFSRRDKIEAETIMKYIYKLLEKHEEIEIKYILLKLDYSINNCRNKSWEELTNDQGLIRAMAFSNSMTETDDIIDALTRVNVRDSMMRSEKEQLLAELYFAKEKYRRALGHADNVIEERRVIGLKILSNAMLGDIGGTFEELKKRGPEYDEVDLCPALITLAWNCDLEAYNSYTNIVSVINQKLEEMNPIMHSYSERRVESEDYGFYMVQAFDLVTNWIIERRECDIISSFDTSDETRADSDRIDDKKCVFSLLDDNLYSDIESFMETMPLDMDKVTEVYDKYYHSLEGFREILKAQFLINYYRIGIGPHIFERACKLLEETKIDNNPTLESALKDLLEAVYIDVSCSDEREIRNSLEPLISKYGINIGNLEELTAQEKISQSLSTNGKLEYKAACMLFDDAVKRDYGNKDAGILSLAFYRLIENESNERIWKPVANLLDVDNLDIVYKTYADNNLSGDEKNNYKRTWRAIVVKFKEFKEAPSTSKGFMLGQLFYLAESINPQKVDPAAITVRSALESLLTQDGQRLFNNGIFSEWYGSDNRNKYRNPPAHNKYLRMEVAKECRKYVEEQLLTLKTMLNENAAS